MKQLHKASSMLEGQMLQDLLQQEGIECFLGGSYLQGAIGELPASGLIRLFVEEDDWSRADRIIKSWMAAPPMHDELG
jgi:Putative prokaryotic signal transducing protein